MALCYLLLLLNGLALQTENTVEIEVFCHKTEKPNYEHEMFKKIIELHNARNKKQYSIKYNYFPDVLTIKNIEEFNTRFIHQDKKNNTISYGALTIRKTQNRDFSMPILPVFDVIYCLKDKLKNLDNKLSIKVGYWYNVNTRKIISELKKDKALIAVPYVNYDELIPALELGQIDGYVGDSVDGLDLTSNHGDKIYKHTIFKKLSTKQQYMGFMFPKDSTLKKEIDTILMYYIKSPHFYKLIRQFFTHDFSIEFRRNIGIMYKQK